MRAKQATFTYGQKFVKKKVNLAISWKPEIERVKCDILGDFQTRVMLLLCATIVANAARL